MRYLVPCARYLLGALLLLFGLNGFLQFIPPPPGPPQPSDGGVLMEALVGTPYLWALIKGTEVLVGVLLLVNRFVPLALVLFAPGAVNIVLYHLFLDPATIAVGVVLLALELGLLVAYRHHYRPLVLSRASSTPSTAARTRGSG